jgi:hypothetical protein
MPRSRPAPHAFSPLTRTRAARRAASRDLAGNLLGCLLAVAAVVSTGLLAGNPVLPALAVAKTSMPLGQVGPRLNPINPV